MFGVLALIGLVGQALTVLWPLLVGLVVLYAAYLAWRGVQHRDHAEQASDGCLFCRNEVINLQRREQAELDMQQAQKRPQAQRAEAERLRAKYRK